VLIKLQQLSDSLANASCDADDDATLLKALAEQHECASDLVDHRQHGINQSDHQLHPIHQAILRCDALAVQNIAKTRY
jgi:hypothetical protein